MTIERNEIFTLWRLIYEEINQFNRHCFLRWNVCVVGICICHLDIQPCAAECPNDKCKRFGWNVKKIARTEDGSEEVKCTHFQYGTDVINYYVVTYEGKCMFCGTSKTMQSRESDPPVCNGRSHI